MSPPSFDLIEEPWILVQRRDGTADEVSLLQLFAEAGDIARITGDLPTQGFAIMRLALAVLHCAIDAPQDLRAWNGLWRTPTLPVEAVGDYLDRFRDRFDLLHPETPFYQVADLRTEKGTVGSLTGFLADAPVGNPYFRMREAAGLERIGFGEAARWLVHCQAYDASGIKSGAVDDPRVKGGKGYPIGPGYSGRFGGVLAEGDDLRETLLLNLIAFDFREWSFSADDAPLWERDAQTAAIEQRPGVADDAPSGQPLGPLDLYTWQSRRIRLAYDADGVTGVLICQGDKLPSANLHRVEPFTGWRRSPTQEKLRKQPLIYLPKPHDPHRNVWRGLAAMLPGTAGRSNAGASFIDPLVLEWLGVLANGGSLPADRPVRTRVIGASYINQEAVVEDIVDDALTMAAAVFDQDRPELAIAIRDAVADAEDAVRALTALAADLVRAAGNRDSVDSARGKAADDAYAQLDGRFRQWLARLGPDTAIETARRAWQQEVYRRIRSIGDELVAQAGDTAWIGRTVNDYFVSSPRAGLVFHGRLRKALPMAYTDVVRAADNTTEEHPRD